MCIYSLRLSRSSTHKVNVKTIILWVNVRYLRISQLTSQAKSRDRFHALNVPYTALATPFTVRRVVSGHTLLACVS